ncbi:MAG: precorrin-6A/cobalt-precorrin-6A reductase, partial [Pseudomonadota bacterium]
GRTRAPRRPAGELRIGGYGGPNLLASFLAAEGIDAVVDAAHPFASRIAMNAAAACGVADRPRLKLLRPPYDAGASDGALRVSSIAAAAALPPAGARVFLALGAGGAQAFSAREDLKICVRTVEPTKLHAKHAPPWRYYVGSPSSCVMTETAILKDSGADWLIARDSGGVGAAKLLAAQAIGMTRVLIDRPAPPEGLIVSEVEAACEWLDEQAARRPGPRLVYTRAQATAVGE